MKNCLLCGTRFKPSRSDAIFCTGTCRAKYNKLKKAGELSGLQLEKEEPEDKPQFKPEYKDQEKITIANTVDAMDLAPFLNLVGEGNLGEFGLNEINSSSKLNQENQSKEETGEENQEEASHAPTENINLPEKYLTKIVKNKSLLYIMYEGELAQCRKNIKAGETEIARLNALIQEEKNKNGSGYILAGAGAGLGGSLLFNHFQEKDKPLEPDKILDRNGKPILFLNKNRFAKKAKKLSEEKKSGLGIWEILLISAVGTATGAIVKAATEDDREKEKALKIAEYQNLIKEYVPVLEKLREREANLITALDRQPEFIIREDKILNPLFPKDEPKNKQKENAANINENLSGQNNNESKIELNGINASKNTDTMTKKTNLETDKIFSMKTIAGLKHQLLNFKGKWEDFFGLPQTNFFCVIHGMSGEGKSHFAMQFGKYLAENFGNVLYISGEEGFATTFQQKIKSLGANVERYYGTEMKTGDELLNDVPNRYHFIIIDSLNNMGIEPETMRAIRNKFKQSGIIAICQSTKEGKIRGSYETVHDSDMAVKVVNGIATTNKNRFKEKHKDFDVFSVYRKKIDKTPVQNKKDELDEGFDNTIK